MTELKKTRGLDDLLSVQPQTSCLCSACHGNEAWHNSSSVSDMRGTGPDPWSEDGFLD